MGGNAFAQAAAAGQPKLNTPRMTPKEYDELKSIYLAKLQNCMPAAKVACLVEAPEKEDYGDMDILVAIDRKMDFINLATAIGAAGLICHSSGGHQMCSLAVPKDGSRHGDLPVVYKMVHENAVHQTGVQLSIETTDEQYAQIDVEVIPTEMLEWHIFYSSYGDLSGLLGHTVKNLGLRITDSGLWLQMIELDVAKSVPVHDLADSDGRIFLSKEPAKVMEFMGLRETTFDKGFATCDELYSWAASSRLLFPETVKSSWNKSNEGQRERKRGMYAVYFKEWLPLRMDMKPDQDEEERQQAIARLRQDVQNDAVGFFRKREEYDTKRHAIILKTQNMIAANHLKPLVAKHSGTEGRKLAEVYRAFQRHVDFDSLGQPYVAETAHKNEQSQLYRFLADDGKTLKDPDGADAWVKEHWELLKTMLRQKGATGEAHADKGVVDKEKAAAGGD
ncbi:uncharacterized protein LTR77_009841 [Saxophila tyrrhenica]|uniref:Uncharacterized protein n=1 Tax=Saxophila tyrrhenica TaxID=1690608 RepID=A0AAV9NXZ3_9PEZI|nr:hypothetical protein LTR77_009841 [Saxophila tyrrhenica]